MVLTIIYDVLGGIKAVVYSDVLQMGLLLLAILCSLVMLWDGIFLNVEALSERTTIYQDDWGFSGNQYGFWPMLIGGMFLYMAYYGCDQSQAQRILAARDNSAATRVLLFNGLFRFPLVFLYCMLGLGIAAYAMTNPGFIESLPKTAQGKANINLAFPNYVLNTFPPGLVGIVIVGLFAAAMSSIDSALNSLSASTLNDFVLKFRDISKRRQLIFAKLTTLFWGLFAVAFSFQVEAIASTVLEVINKVGSLMNGPLLSLFVIAFLTKNAKPKNVIIGFTFGFIGNLVLWLGLPKVSWLWWNVFGCFVSIAVFFLLTKVKLELPNDFYKSVSAYTSLSLIITFLAILVLCWLFPLSFTR
jgi:SSS family solute:Na+ symporter